MGRKRSEPEEIVAKHRQVDVLTAQGNPPPAVAPALSAQGRRSVSERFAAACSADIVRRNVRSPGRQMTKRL